MVSEIIKIVDRIYAGSAASPETGDAKGHDELLLVNHILQIACHVGRNDSGKYTLYVYDQITGKEFCSSHDEYGNLKIAIEEGNRLIHSGESPLAAKIA
jgi:hypothetical protein